jgi:ABC-type antimicrobial peptide transport system permease subunit
VVIHAVNQPDVASEDVAAAIRQLDPQVTMPAMRTIDDQLLGQMAPQHFGMLVLGALGAIAVLLTILGTSVLAESMAHLRKREMNIRAALGATSLQLVRIVLAETTRLVGIGLAIGLGLTWLAAGTIRAFLFRVEPLDVPTLGLVAGGILLLALAVSLPTAIRTARVDLATVLRED